MQRKSYALNFYEIHRAITAIIKAIAAIKREAAASSNEDVLIMR